MYGDQAPPFLVTALCELGTYGVLLQKQITRVDWMW